MKTEQKHWCYRCGGDVQVQRQACARCQPLIDAENLVRWKADWRAMNAPYADTLLERLPDQDAVARVMAHEFRGGRGLTLMGATGLGKTRTAWLKVRQQVLRGRRVEVLGCTASTEYLSKFGKDGDQVWQWAQRLCKADLLLLDDAFKNKFSDGFEGLVFSVIDHRTSHGLPLLVTSNDTGDTLAARLSADRGEPLVRRLREFCDGVLFKAVAK